MRRVILYGAPGCHLCQEALQALEVLRRTFAFDLREVDIHSHADLQRRYLVEIPVVEVDGIVVSSGGVDFDAVRAALSG